MFLKPKCMLRTGALVLLTLALTKAGAAQLVLYDNFKSTRIDTSKWISANGPDFFVVDAVRQLAGEEENRRLHLSQIAYSATTDDTGTIGGEFGLAFINPNAVTTVSFGLTVNELTLVGCNTNSGEDVTEAEFRGRFFNINSSPTDPSGDVLAVIGIGRSVQGSALTVAGFVMQGANVLGYQVIGTVATGSTNTLFLEWDQAHHRFGFRLNGGPEVFEPYSVSDTTPPFFASKHLGLARVIPDCTSTPRPYASLDALFGKVYVNP